MKDHISMTFSRVNFPLAIKHYRVLKIMIREFSKCDEFAVKRTTSFRFLSFRCDRKIPNDQNGGSEFGFCCWHTIRSDGQ